MKDMLLLLGIVTMGVLSWFMDQEKKEAVVAATELRDQNGELAREITVLEGAVKRLESKAVAAVQERAAVAVTPGKSTERPPDVPPVPVDVVQTPAQPVVPEVDDRQSRAFDLRQQIARLDTKLYETKKKQKAKEYEWAVDATSRGIRVSDTEKQQFRAQVEEFLSGLQSQRDALVRELAGL